MHGELLDAARHSPSAAQFETFALDLLARAVGYDAAFIGLRGAPMTVRGLPQHLIDRAVRPGSIYEAELAPVKEAALAARGVAVDTEVLGERRVAGTAYFRDLARPLGGKHSLLGYFVIRGQVIGGLMLGRTGGGFRPDEVARVVDLLPALAVSRASYCPPTLGHTPLPAAGHVRWPWGERILARRRDGLTEVRVRDEGAFREMVARDLLSGYEMVWTRAGLKDSGKSGWPYIDLLHVAAGLANRRGCALFIGCGGGLAPRQFAMTYPGIAIDVVEPASVVIALAREFFGLDDIPNLKVHRADGAAFLRAARERWDIIVVDAYDGDEIGEGMGTRGFFRGLRDRLRAGGAFAFNVVGTLDGSGLPGCSVRDRIHAAAAEFDDVRVIPVMTPRENYDRGARRNVVIVGVA